MYKQYFAQFLPSRYQYRYGKAQQVVMMQSLKDTLVKQAAFSDVEIVSKNRKLKPNEAEIQQEEVSEILMDKIIRGIKTWQS